MSEPAQGAEPPSVLQPQNLIQKMSTSSYSTKLVFTRSFFYLESRWDDHELLPVIGRGNSLEGLEPLEGVLATLSLVGGHATYLHNKPRFISVIIAR